MLGGMFGDASKTVVIEEFLDGIECSVFVLTDGNDYKVLPVAKDYKRIGEGNTGLNTGGMGAVSPVPFADEVFMAKVDERIIRPTVEELESFEPDFVVYNASKAKVENYKELGLRSETAAMFNITSREQVIVNTWYGGEMKKGMFSMMNYYLPLKGIASMHCSANTDMNGENTAIFFGLSGTGKTTLSTDPKRLLIGDDEHGWDDNGIFNFEGGCYAKVIDLDKESEPDIYNAIKTQCIAGKCNIG